MLKINLVIILINDILTFLSGIKRIYSKQISFGVSCKISKIYNTVQYFLRQGDDLSSGIYSLRENDVSCHSF
jgi:hypothetical protein